MSCLLQFIRTILWSELITSFCENLHGFMSYFLIINLLLRASQPLFIIGGHSAKCKPLQQRIWLIGKNCIMPLSVLIFVQHVKVFKQSQFTLVYKYNHLPLKLQKQIVSRTCVLLYYILLFFSVILVVNMLRILQRYNFT